MTKIKVIDSHTGGEPTRVVLPGQVPLTGETMTERLECFKAQFDHLRRGIILEPRGSDVWVGAILTDPISPGTKAGVIFFNNEGCLGMCGHGTIGVVETLKYLGQIDPGELALDTPVGPVQAWLHESGEVAIRNVQSYRFRKEICFEVKDIGMVRGDVAYGGNWFFIVHEPKFEISMDRSSLLADTCRQIARSMEEHGIVGEKGASVNHIELESTVTSDGCDSRNFVLCPGGAYDRSPCGTGTSAKLACLFEDGLLEAGHWFTQESVTLSRFRGSVEAGCRGVIPTIVGRAYVTAESILNFEKEDPLAEGFRG